MDHGSGFDDIGGYRICSPRLFDQIIGAVLSRLGYRLLPLGYRFCAVVDYFILLAVLDRRQSDPGRCRYDQSDKSQAKIPDPEVPALVIRTF